jgi:hypothetical protein
MWHNVDDRPRLINTTITNCIIRSRRDEPQSTLFEFPPDKDGLCYVNLDRYAIVPLEDLHSVADEYKVARITRVRRFIARLFRKRR